MNSIADELITHGWQQGEYEDDNGRVCLMSAARRAYGGSWRTRKCNVVEEVIEQLVRTWGDWECPEDWNDHPGRTYDDVLQLAKQADEILAADLTVAEYFGLEEGADLYGAGCES